jgi:protocatechuate 3,4-dioxygenase beta subunit
MIRKPPVLTRRQTLLGLGLAAGALVARDAAAQGTASQTGALLPGAGACILTPEVTEGPFYFDPKLERSDVTEGRHGVPMGLLMQVVEASNCMPIAGARVDVWHCDAIGHYSGEEGQGDGQDVSTVGETFLRGHQLTSDAGEVLFATIYPGWYRGRTPHIHFKVLLGETELVTGQIYFPDALSEYIYVNVAPYNTRLSPRDTTNAVDGVLRSSGGGHETFCNIKEETDRYLASLIVGISRDGAPAAAAEPEGPPPGDGPLDGEGAPPPEAAPRRSLVPGPAAVEELP